MSLRHTYSTLKVITLVLFLCSSAIAEVIIKSPNDKRMYKSIILENQLEIMLISDPETDRAAAALDIKVGSGNDPKERPGLAHFLEHMLFLGTEKYPQAGEYQEFIQQYGGNHNAYTSFSDTNYFFEIDASHFEPALDRFSQQFISPLFNPEYVEREANAVHSEYSAKIKDDNRRTYSAFQSVMNSDHAYSNFSVGNLTTLATDNQQSLHKDLVYFYKANYSSNLMKAAIYGKEPIPILESFARKYFSQIANRHLIAKEHTAPLFKDGTLPALLEVEPEMDSRILEFSFPIPSSENYYQEKPTYYLSNLIGHEGEGSLLSALKAAGLAESLSAGASMDTGHAAIFSVRLSLTQNGVQNWQDIASALFNYIDLIKKDGLQSFYYEEQSKMLDLAFQFQQKSQPIHYVSSLAGTLQEIPAKQAIRYGYLLTPYSPDLYTKFLEYLSPNNVLITVVSKGLSHNLSTEWYQTPYSIQKIKPQSLKQASTKSFKLTLPERNSFIPDEAFVLEGKTMATPTRILSNTDIDAWYAFDNEFSDPSASFFINIRSPKANDSPKNALFTELLTRVVQDELNEFTYPATLAGLDFSLYNHIRGISIKVSGYPSKQSTLLSRILNTLTNLPINSMRLEQIKEDLKRELENSAKRKPYEQTAGKLRELLIEPLWSDEEKLAQIKTVDRKALAAFRNELLSQIDVVTLTHGNTTRASALALNQLVNTYLIKNSTHKSVNRGEILLLKDGDRYLYELNSEHPDTGYALLIQGNSKSYKDRAFFSLIGQILSSPYYNDIRTEKQLGYIVFATPFSMFEVPGIAFIVQSPVASYQELNNKTIQFLNRFINNDLKDMSNETFEQHRNALIKLINEKDKKLTDRSGRFWREIDEENYDFNTNQMLVASIEKISQEFVIKQMQQTLQQGRYLLTVKQGDDIKVPLNKSTKTEFESFQFNPVQSKNKLRELSR